MTDALVEAVGDGIEAAWNGSGSGGKPNRLPPIDLSQHERVHLATAALQAIEAAGYRVVPVEATEERLTAMAKVREGDQPYYILDMYREMYGAAIGGER